MFSDIHPEVLSLFRHPELNAKTPQNTSDQESTDRSQAIGHQHGLQLTQNKSTTPLFRQNLTGRMLGDQLSIGKEARQQGTGGAANAMDGIGVEGIVQAQLHLALDRDLAEHGGDGADRDARADGHKTSGRGHTHQA